MRSRAISTAAKREGTRRAATVAKALLIHVLAASALALPGCGADPATALAAAEGAKTAVEVARTTAEAIPAAIQAVADQFANGSSRNWGQPSRIYVTDDYYIFMYDTPASEMQSGLPRIVMVDRLGRVERLQRMQRGQF